MQAVQRSEQVQALTLNDESVVNATPAHIYQTLTAVREAGCTVLQATTEEGKPPIFLIDEPAADNALAKVAEDMGTMKHVSIEVHGYAAEVVWHVTKKAQKAPAKKAAVKPAAKAPAKKVAVK